MQGCVDVAVHFIAVSPSRELPVTARRDDALISVALESGVRRFGESSTVFEVATPQFNGLPGFNCWPAVRSWPKRATQVSLQQQAAQFGRDRHRSVRQPGPLRLGLVELAGPLTPAIVCSDLWIWLDDPFHPPLQPRTSNSNWPWLKLSRTAEARVHWLSHATRPKVPALTGTASDDWQCVAGAFVARNLNFATLNRRGLPLCFERHQSRSQPNLDGSEEFHLRIFHRGQQCGGSGCSGGISDQQALVGEREPGSIRRVCCQWEIPQVVLGFGAKVSKLQSGLVLLVKRLFQLLWPFYEGARQYRILRPPLQADNVSSQRV